MSNLDNRIANADQLLTQDVEKLSNSIAELYSNLSKVLKPRCLVYGLLQQLDTAVVNMCFLHVLAAFPV